MPYYDTSQEWLRQSQLLLQARPNTTRITTKYSIKPVKVRKSKKTDSAGDARMPDAAAVKSPRGSLTLKTYDEVTSVTLKYRTNKAAEVSRLILSVGKLSRPMAGLPELKDEVMTDAPEVGSGAGTPAVEKSERAIAGGSAGGKAPTIGQQGGGGGLKGKKKKGRK